MRYLLIVPELGLTPNGHHLPGGLSQHGRCVVRALASSPSIQRLGVWSQVDLPGTEEMIARLAAAYAHPSLDLEVRVFGGSRAGLALAVARVCLTRQYDRVFYLLVNQSMLGALPRHPPYGVWEIGWEVFRPLSFWKYRALCRAHTLVSSSHSTAELAARSNPGLPSAKVVNLCFEPPLFTPEPVDDSLATEHYDPAGREPAVMIVANMLKEYLFKGHQQLIAAWPEVVASCPQAELWIVGMGDGRPQLEPLAQGLPPAVSRQIKFFGYLSPEELHQRFLRCRVFAMPSIQEGFGLVFVEAARYGIPCIGGKHDGVKEIVLHQETGLLVEQEPHEIAEACRQLLMDDDLARKLGHAGRQRYLHNFRFRHFRERLLSALELAS